MKPQARARGDEYKMIGPVDLAISECQFNGICHAWASALARTIDIPKRRSIGNGAKHGTSCGIPCR